MKCIEQKKARAKKMKAVKDKIGWFLTRPLVPIAWLFLFWEKKHLQRQDKRHREQVANPWSLDPRKAHKYITQMIVDVLMTDPVCIFSWERGRNSNYAFNSNRDIKSGRITKWWHRVDYQDLTHYVSEEYTHPELEKYHYYPFRDILSRYTTMREREFDIVPFDSPEYEPKAKAEKDWDEQTKILEEFLPCWYPSRWEYSDHCIIFRPKNQ